MGKSLLVKNYCGYIGSFIADLILQVLGLSAWILVAGGLRKAHLNFKNIDEKANRLRWLWLSLLLVAGSSLFALYGPNATLYSGEIRIGGWLGHIVSTGLTSAFNKIGVQIILWTGFVTLLIFFTEKSLNELMSYPVKAVKWIIEHAQIKAMFSQAANTVRSKLDSTVRALFAEPELATATANQQADQRQRRFIELSNTTEKENRVPAEPVETEEESDIEALPQEIEKQASTTSEPVRRKVVLKKKIERRIENWELPKISLLEDPPYGRKKVDDREIRMKGEILINKMKQFGVNGEVVAAKPGPAVTMFEFKPNADVKISKITDLADDLSLALSAESVRIIAPIPGRDVVGIETSNSFRETVYLKEILASDEFWDEKIFLPLAMGCEANGNQKVVDLRKMPHMMVAGTTGSGKSVFIVSLLTGLLFRHSPKTLRMILIDPKQVDLAAFLKIPHLLMPPIREPKKAIGALRWAIKEMDKRYRSMHKFGARDLEGFNRAVQKLSSTEAGEHEEINTQNEGQVNPNAYYFTEQPYIVIVCEEFGDLMAVDKQNVEQGVVRLAQMARACGIHLVLAMQSPRKDVVTGLIKTNIPGRVSFKVNSKMDSRIILDESGGERLLSRGDMLFVSPGTSKPERHHGPWVTDPEIERVTTFWTDQAEPEFDPLAMKALEAMTPEGSSPDGSEAIGLGEEEFDERYDEILSYVSGMKEVSASLLQRKFRLGYPRAARMIEIFESEGVVGPANGSKPRQVLVNELK